MEIAPTGQDVWTLEINDDEEGTSLLAVYASLDAAVEAVVCEALHDAECFEQPLTREDVLANLQKDDSGNVTGWARPPAWTGMDWSTMSLDIGRSPLLGEVAQ